MKVELIEETKWDGTVFHKIYVDGSLYDLFVISDDKDKQNAIKSYERALHSQEKPKRTVLKSEKL